MEYRERNQKQKGDINEEGYHTNEKGEMIPIIHGPCSLPEIIIGGKKQWIDW
jgi:hypothetical protein